MNVNEIRTSSVFWSRNSRKATTTTISRIVRALTLDPFGWPGSKSSRPVLSSSMGFAPPVTSVAAIMHDCAP